MNHCALGAVDKERNAKLEAATDGASVTLDPMDAPQRLDDSSVVAALLLFHRF